MSTAPSFAKTTANGFTIQTTAESAVFTAGSGAESLVSPLINTNVDNINDKKLVMGFDVTVAYANVAATLILQVSHNGTDFVDYTTLSSDTTPDVTGVKLFVVDTTNLFAPFYRLVFNKGELNAGTSGKGKFFFANK